MLGAQQLTDEFVYSAQVTQPKESNQLRLYRHSAATPGAQQLTLTSSSTLHRPRILGVRSAQVISPLGLNARSPTAHFDEFVYSAQATQPKESDQIKLYRHSASAPGAQQLTLTSSSTLNRPRSLGVRSAQAISPLSLSARSSAAHFDEFVYFTPATQPRSQISSGYIATGPQRPEPSSSL